ncbi:hypothetical protein [Thalassotalea sediminis]|uniref:hypothetical protein n=1 Tax=Thalassotalea sediminis TaxID=1759089 RepID=UPI0025731572|nr:hypothetical protein [Thalassotalea sediminis]
MKSVINRKLSLIATGAIFLIGCSKHPTTVAIDNERLPSDIEVSSTAYIFNNDLAMAAEKDGKIAKLYHQVDELIRGEIPADLSDVDVATDAYIKALNDVRAQYAKIPELVKQAQQERVAIEQEKVDDIQAKIAQQKELQAKLDEFTKPERHALANAEKAVLAKEKTRKEGKTALIKSINNYIVSSRIAIKKLDEESSDPVSWSTKNKYRGKCPDRRGHYLVENLAHLSECLYFSPAYSLRKNSNIEQIAEVIEKNVEPYIEADWALKMSVGTKLGLYKKYNDAKKDLEKAVIVAENNTDVNANKVKRELRNLQRKLEYANHDVNRVKESPITEDQIIVQNKPYLDAKNLLAQSISDMRTAQQEKFLANGVLIAKGDINGMTGELPSGSGDFLMLHMNLSDGYRKQTMNSFTNLNQQWTEQVLISRDNAYFDMALNIKDDGQALDQAISAYKTYQRKYADAKKG